MNQILTPFDAEIAKAKVRLEQKQKLALQLSRRAKEAARIARKAASDLEGVDRKKRDRARYIIGGIYMTRMLRQEPETVRRWLENAALSPADRALVEDQLSPVLNQPGPT